MYNNIQSLTAELLRFNGEPYIKYGVSGVKINFRVFWRGNGLPVMNFINQP